MKCSKVLTVSFLLVSFLFVSTSFLNAEVKLPHIFSDNMVLQHQQAVNIWGWAEPGEKITVMLGAQEKKTKADKNGQWRLQLAPMRAGGPFEMQIKGNNTLEFNNVLVGEVWICSGQSNMEWHLRAVKNGAQEVDAANYPHIRLFKAPKKTAPTPLNDIDASWKSCTSVNAHSFSAVAYFFGRKLHQTLDVPIGLIQSAWGGTRIEPWTPAEGFEGYPELADIRERIQNADSVYAEKLKAALNQFDSWLKTARQAQANGKPVENPPQFPGHPLDYRQAPTSLYNAMIHPLVPYTISGALWYQGEANRTEGMLYYTKMQALINGWRNVWQQGDFPFYFVQLAPYAYHYTNAEEEKVYELPRIWEAQRRALTIANTGMAVTTDITNLVDIHPRNKQDVGERLARWALNKQYGKTDILPSGPLFKSMQIRGKIIELAFDYVGCGLTTRDGQTLDWFEIAGPDKKFVRAQAKIAGDKVLVWSPEIEAPVAVRFGWHECAEPNLINKQGLPASPFKTDSW